MSRIQLVDASMDLNMLNENTIHIAPIIIEYDIYLVKPQTTTTAILALAAFKNRLHYDLCMQGKCDIREEAVKYIEKQMGERNEVVLDSLIHVRPCNPEKNSATFIIQVTMDLRSIVFEHSK